jgi:hypothetical protein
MAARALPRGFGGLSNYSVPFHWNVEMKSLIGPNENP